MRENNSSPLPRLFTGRLSLRQLELRDAPEIRQLRSDPRVNEFIARSGAITLAEARSFIEKINKGIANRECCYWAITRKGSDALIGTICLWNFTADRVQAEIGYELSPACQGQGFMPEAIETVSAYGFQALKLEAIKALSRADNVRSLALLKRTGFQPGAAFRQTPGAAESGLVVYFLTP
ncbi:MAG: GNAT family N-acetyltransferase [Phaeodactylibacter sp.]|nr:GNAT family N-acetyltransferase [Phaeodactylibacter sp.]MCB9297693.1 GNAT family N-acetyltransferase [Lewinellaceae bacterium]